MYKITKIAPQIFRGYDIRGLVDSELTLDVYYTLGKAYATFLARRRISESAVGRDIRLTSKVYSKAFIAGLNSGGINTYDLGLSMSQIVYFSSYFFKTKGGAMITASHNPKEYNGLKLSVGYSDTMMTDEIMELKKIADTADFVSGSGVNKEIDIFPDYLSDVLKHFSLRKKWKVVVEGCNTGSGVFYSRILKSAGCEVIEQNITPDGNFPLGTPDPTESTVLERLSQRVKLECADIGFAYDSDGDRMAVVSNTGQVLWMDTIVAIYAQDILDFLPGAPIVFNALCSKQVKEVIENRGGRAVMWKTGHSFIKAKVKEERAPFGGELSGHIFFMDNFYGHDDAAFATLRLLQYLERKNMQLSGVVSLLPHYFSSPEIKLGLDEEIKFKFIDNDIKTFLQKEFTDGEFNYIDGVRVDLPDSMIIVRASQNGPYITIKFESNTEDGYFEIKKLLKNFLDSKSQVKWSGGVNVEALNLDKKRAA